MPTPQVEARGPQAKSHEALVEHGILNGLLEIDAETHFPSLNPPNSLGNALLLKAPELLLKAALRAGPMYIDMYVHIHVCTYTYMFIHIFMYMYLYMYMHMPMRVHRYMSMSMSVHASMYS